MENNRRDQGIRLYLIRLNNDSLILLNGDVKTTQKTQDFPRVGKHFSLCKRIDTAIMKMFNTRELTLKTDLNELELYY